MKASPPEVAAPAQVFVGLGANLGDARATLTQALEALRGLALDGPGGGWRRSSWWRTAPVEATGPEFLNAVAGFVTSLGPGALLDALQAIEQRFGRERPYRNAPRTLDLDLLLYGVQGQAAGLQCADSRLTLPHPRAHGRAFVLAPLHELWADGEIPGHGRVADLLEAVRLDPLQQVSRLPD